jgi:hypothetical protein
MEPAYRRKDSGPYSHEIQKSQLIKYLKPILKKYPFCLMSKGVEDYHILNKIETDEKVNFDLCFLLIQNEGLYALINYLFPKTQVKNLIQIIELDIMSSPATKVNLTRVYKNRNTGDKVIPYASAKHIKDGKLTDVIIILLRDYYNPQNDYLSIKETEFLQLYEEVDI